MVNPQSCVPSLAMSLACYILFGVLSFYVTLFFVYCCCESRKNRGNAVAGNTGSDPGDLTVWSVSAGVADGACGGDGGGGDGGCGGDGGGGGDGE